MELVLGFLQLDLALLPLGLDQVNNSLVLSQFFDMFFVFSL